MQVEPVQAAAIAFHFFGMLLLSFAFVKMAIIVLLYSNDQCRGKCFPGTRLPKYPTLIALGSVGFLYLSFTFAYATLTGFPTTSQSTRYLGTAVSLVGGLLALYAVHGAYRACR